MKFEAALETVGSEPVFETSLFLAGDVRRGDVEHQLSRWVRSGRLVKLRRGLYALARPYRKVEAHPFVVANRLVPGSYVSCQSVLAWHGLIPESVPAVVSVSSRRPTQFNTPFGSFVFRHIKRELLFGYHLEAVAPRQQALVASAEKALLDWIHLEPGADAEAFIRELRLQHLEQLDLESLERYAQKSRSPKLGRAARRVASLAAQELAEYESA
jgi:predicted transcriptional regulator of viral defense system